MRVFYTLNISLVVILNSIGKYIMVLHLSTIFKDIRKSKFVRRNVLAIPISISFQTLFELVQNEYEYNLNLFWGNSEFVSNKKWNLKSLTSVYTVPFISCRNGNGMIYLYLCYTL